VSGGAVRGAAAPWRMFVAVGLDAAARAALAQALAGETLPGRVVPADNWHVTLRFAGDLDAPARLVLRAAIGAARLGPAVDFGLTGFGALPSAAKARALVVRVDAAAGGGALTRLAAAVEAAARAAGLPPAPHPFNPHVTLARVRRAIDARDGLARLAARDLPGVVATAGEVVLFRSHLGHGPPRYERVAAWPLAAPERRAQPESSLADTP